MPKKGYKQTEEHRRKISESIKGYKQTEEHRKNLIAAWTPERKKIASEKYKGKNAPFYGKTHTKEARQKMSEAKKGRKHSTETRKKMSEAKKGKNNPMYGRKGKNNPFYGKTHTKEARQRMSEAQKGEKSHMYGKHHSKETIEKITRGVLGTCYKK
jgi:hypothetical protein